ncbi:MAG: DMT family protein [Bacteroidales bacterium]|nr:DMT family protein [Bacteroidales bacterium]
MIVFSWPIAFLEYCFQLPANRPGLRDNGSTFPPMQRKVMQECVCTVVFTVIAGIFFKVRP